MTNATIPKHIAIIPDGNRRWAKKNLKQTLLGHQKGSDLIIDTVLNAKKFGISTLTFYLFSTENWSRPKREVEYLMDLLLRYIVEKREEMVENSIQLETIGDLTAFSKEIQEEIARSKEATKDFNGIRMVLALNYGGRDEICRAVNQMVKDGKREINEDTLSTYLDTSKLPDPDLLIRTSGERRLSNFLLWQLSYTEFYMTDTLWPDFSEKDLTHAIQWFQSRKRRGGG